MSFCKKILFSFVFIVVSGTVNAALVTANGDTVSFTYDDGLTTLFGAPITSGNSLLFLPTNFKAQSLDGGASALTSNTFKLKIDALGGHHISNLALTEKGYYILSGQNANVSALGDLRAVDVKAPFQEAVSKIVTVNPFAQTELVNTGDWIATANLAFTPNITTSLYVSIKNMLLAQTGIQRDIAFFDKNFVRLTVTAVPLPTAVWLFGAGLMGLLSISKHRKMF